MKYIITGVRFNAAKTRIEHCAVHLVNGTSVDEPSLWTWSSVAAAILAGDTFITATWSARVNKWVEGAPVEVFIRSHSDATPADNLNNLRKV